MTAVVSVFFGRTARLLKRPRKLLCHVGSDLGADFLEGIEQSLASR